MVSECDVNMNSQGLVKHATGLPVREVHTKNCF